MAERKLVKTNRRYWLVCTVRCGSEALFTVPLSVAKKFKPERYFDIFEVMARVLFVSNPGGDPLDFNMFRYDPFSQKFATRAQTFGIVPAYFLEGMPWFSFSEELLGLRDLMHYELGVPLRLLVPLEIHNEACKVGSRGLRLPMV